jgi:hypothetical protein
LLLEFHIRLFLNLNEIHSVELKASEIDLRELLSAAVDVAQRAGTIVRKYENLTLINKI